MNDLIRVIQFVKQVKRVADVEGVEKFSGLSNSSMILLQQRFEEEFKDIIITDAGKSRKSVKLTNSFQLNLYHPNALILEGSTEKVKKISEILSRLYYYLYVKALGTSSDPENITFRLKKLIGKDFNLIQFNSVSYVSNGKEFYRVQHLSDYSDAVFPIRKTNIIFLNKNSFVSVGESQWLV